jgi:hypothetical protein
MPCWPVFHLEVAANRSVAALDSAINKLIASIDSITSQLEGAANEQATHDHQRNRREIIALVVAMITLAAVAIYSGLTYSTYSAAIFSGQQQHNDTMQALYNARLCAIDQHTDTVRALARSDTANATAQDTAKRQLRAYITIPEMFIKVDTNTNALSTHVQWKNVGPTPAYDFRGWTCLYVGRISKDKAGIGQAGNDCPGWQAYSYFRAAENRSGTRKREKFLE